MTEYVYNRTESPFRQRSQNNACYDIRNTYINCMMYYTLMESYAMIRLVVKSRISRLVFEHRKTGQMGILITDSSHRFSPLNKTTRNVRSAESLENLLSMAYTV